MAKKILLIEDEMDLRNLYETVLRDAGMEVETADEGRKGWEMIQRGGYDLILLDIMLPYIDGLEMLEKLQHEDSPRQDFGQIVLLTNLAQDQTIARGISFGVRGYMVKSDYDPEQLIQAVNEFLS